MVQEGGLVEMNWWPVDRLIAGYFGLMAVLIVSFWSRLPEAPWLLALHAAGILLLALAVRYPRRSFVFRHWYPLLYVACCYKEMAILIPRIRTGLDRQLAALDFAIWHANPTVWLERIQSPALTEAVQWLYSLFIPAVLLIAALLWRQRRFEEFRRYAFLISLGYLVSYLGYLLVPARGPRFLLAHLQNVPLQGLWLCDTLRAGLDRLESAHYDCFPSGHTELTMLAWWGSRQVSEALGSVYFAYTLAIIFATVYLRYHYTVDVMAGVVAGASLILTTPYLYRLLEGTSRCEMSKSFGFRTGGRESSS